MAIGILPNEIPVSGERYNLTLQKTGKGKGGQIARFLIDGGEYAGKRVSCVVDDDLDARLLAALIAAAGDSYEVELDREKAGFWIDLNRFARQIRFSGTVIVRRHAAINDEMVAVEPDYQESNVRVTYHIEDFDAPTGESELAKRFKGSF